VDLTQDYDNSQALLLAVLNLSVLLPLCFTLYRHSTPDMNQTCKQVNGFVYSEYLKTSIFNCIYSSHVALHGIEATLKCIPRVYTSHCFVNGLSGGKLHRALVLGLHVSLTLE